MLSFLRAALAAPALADFALFPSAVAATFLSFTVTVHLYLPLRFLSLYTCQELTHYTYKQTNTYLSSTTFVLGSLLRSSCKGGKDTVPLKEAAQKRKDNNLKLQNSQVKESCVSVYVCACDYIHSYLEYQPILSWK